MRLRPGVPPGWQWEPAFAQDLVCWATALRWQDGPGDVTLVKLALDCETVLGRALPASPHQQLRGMRVPLGERAQVLRHAARLLQRHMAAGRFLQGAPSDRCRVLIPLGGRLCAGLRARPFFAARVDMALQLQLQGLALHLQEAWLHRLRTPARIRPGGGGDTLPHDLFLPPPKRGACTALLRSPAAAGARCGGRPSRRAAPAAAGRGQRVGGCPVYATWPALVPPLPAAGLGNQPVLPRGARGTQGAGTGAPPPPPPAATGPVPAGAGTGGPPGRGKRALGMDGAGQPNVHNVAGAKGARTARPKWRAAS